MITDTDRRGAQVFAVQLGDELGARGRRIETVALTRGKDPNGLPVEVLGEGKLAPATLRALRRRTKRARVVVGHGSTTLAACAIATPFRGAKLVYRNIGDPAFWANSIKRMVRSRVLLKRPHVVVAVWPGAAEALNARFGVPRRRLRVIAKGVAAEGFEPATQARREAARRTFGLSNGAPTVVYIGALGHEKDVGAAIRAVSEIADARLLAVGSGPERAQLEALGRSLAPGRIIFTGPTDRPSEALAAGDVFILPSRTEGIPGVFIEAGFMRLPAVATDVGGVSTIVLDSKTGRVVPPQDPGALVGALREMLVVDASVGRRAREHCLANFEIGIVGDAWDELLGELGAWD